MGQSSYDAFEVELQRRFHNGLNLLASYTWSKTITDADSIMPYFANLAGGGAIQNPFNLSQEKAVSNRTFPKTSCSAIFTNCPLARARSF